MELVFKPKVLSCQGSWTPKMEGVILVKKKSDIKPLFKLLCEQDDYWESYEKLIQVAPKGEIEDINQIRDMCQYVGKTDIWEETLEDIRNSSSPHG